MGCAPLGRLALSKGEGEGEGQVPARAINPSPQSSPLTGERRHDAKHDPDVTDKLLTSFYFSDSTSRHA